MPDDLINPVKARMRAGDVALGLNVRIGRSADIVRVAKATGHDFVFIDVQHPIFNIETIAHMAHTALAIGVAPVVRVRGIDDPDVSMLLDNGVTGIVYPDIANAAQARRAVEVCKFQPIGKRSVAGGYPHFDYRSIPLTQSVPRSGMPQVDAAAAVFGAKPIAAQKASAMRTKRFTRPASQSTSTASGSHSRALPPAPPKQAAQTARPTSL